MAKKKNIQLSKEEIEKDPYFVLPIRNTVIFPGVLIPVTEEAFLDKISSEASRKNTLLF